MAEVILEKCGSYKPQEVLASVRSVVDKLGGISSVIKPGQKILLKPNVLAGFRIEEAATTHPEIVRAVAKLVKEAGAYPFIGDSPGVGSLSRFVGVTGLKKISEEENVPLVELSTPKDIAFHEGKTFKNFVIASEVFDYDAIINLPKFKTHGLTGITCAVKNLFGCVPGILKSQYHYKLHTREKLIALLSDLARFLKPKLNIVDAVWAMEGEGGPSAGTPKFMGLVAVSRDPFELDSVMQKIIDGENIQGFSFPDFKQIKISSEEIYHLPMPGLMKYLVGWMAEKPVIDQNKCINCGVCVELCPAKALSKSKRKPIFIYSKCIRCFCCQEMCPKHAISIKRNKFADLISSLLAKI